MSKKAALVLVVLALIVAGVVFVSRPAPGDTIIDQDPVSNNYPQMKVVAPNGGEVWQDYSEQNIEWQWSFMPGDTSSAPVDIYLVPHEIVCFAAPCIQPDDYVLGKNINRSNDSYPWAVARDINNAQIPTGEFKIKICLAGDDRYCDVSNGYFTIGPRPVPL